MDHRVVKTFSQKGFMLNTSWKLLLFFQEFLFVTDQISSLLESLVFNIKREISDDIHFLWLIFIMFRIMTCKIWLWRGLGRPSVSKPYLHSNRHESDLREGFDNMKSAELPWLYPFGFSCLIFWHLAMAKRQLRTRRITTRKCVCSCFCSLSIQGQLSELVNCQISRKKVRL